MIRSFRSLLISVLALWKGVSQKEASAKAGIREKTISYHLRKGALGDDTLYQGLLTGLEARRAEVAIVTGCLEALEALEGDSGLTAAESDEVEMGVLEVSRLSRRVFSEAARRSREAPPLDAYPRTADLLPARRQGGKLWSLLADLSEDQQLAVVRVARQFQRSTA